MTINTIPEKIINYNVYNELDKLVGIGTDFKLPNFETQSETISGAGIAGEYESPTPGHFASQEVEIQFRVLNASALELMKKRLITIFLRGVIQELDIASAQIVEKDFKVTVRGLCKGLDAGTVAPGKPMEATCKIETLYTKIESAGLVLLEVDKLNMIHVVNNVDQLATIRTMM